MTGNNDDFVISCTFPRMRTRGEMKRSVRAHPLPEDIVFRGLTCFTSI